MSCSPEILRFLLQCEAEEDVDIRAAKRDHLQKNVDEFSPASVMEKTQQEPSPEDNIFIVRISTKNKCALKDYAIMKDKKNPHAYKWDRDASERIQTGDWLGFILGEVNDAKVELFKVDTIGGARPPHWKNTNYTSQKQDKLVCLRDVVTFEKRESVHMEWNHWKKRVNYSDRYMPRGTISAKNPFG